MDTPKDEDTPKDSAAKQGFHQGYAEDMEGHRSHTVYVGVHLPGTQRPPRHRRQQSQPGGADSASDEDGDDEDERPRKILAGRRGRLASITDDGEIFTPPAQRVQFILGEDADNGAHTSHPLFSEMEELVQKGNDIEWKETARWVKFEEDVEEGGNRWSKPHVATLSLHSLFELRSMLLNGAVMLDLEAASLEQVADLLLDHMAATSMLAPELRDKASAPSAASPLPCVQRALRHV